MKRMIVISLLIICIQFICAQKNDTIYYDVNWKGVQEKTLATYMRIVYKSNDSQNKDIVKDFYITGELQSEGLIPIYIDKNDDKKSKFKGHTINYYKSGKKQLESYRNDSCQLEGESISYYENGNLKQAIVFKLGSLPEVINYNEKGVKLFKGTVKDGQWEGEYTEYYDNGLRKSKSTVRNGKLNGTFYQFNLDGSYSEIEMIDGKYKNDYYIFVHVDGKRDKIKNNTLK